MNYSEEPRHYRKIFKGDNLVYFTVKINQTDLCIGALCNLRTQAVESIKKYRQQVEEYIRRQPVFLHSLVPVAPLPDAPLIVRHMCGAAEAAGVGPMAAIAGAFSQYVAGDLLSYSGELVVENGGDIFIAGGTDRTVGIYAGKSEFTGRIGIKIKGDDFPLGICTSSGTVGHSLSFGCADAAVIISKDACLADAAATAVGNMVRSPRDIDKALKKAQTIPGLVGAVVIVGGEMGAWGRIELVRL